MPSHILIVDPEELPRMDLAIQLQEMGFKVEVAENGGEALEILAASHPDLVITELLLGQLSGFEVSSRVAGDPDSSCPVLFYTGFYRSESARQEIIKKYSAAGYFIKPFQLPQLKKAVASIMRPKGSEQFGVANRERVEGRGEPAVPIVQTPVELVDGPSAQAMIPSLFAPTPEGEESTKDTTPASLLPSGLMKEEQIIAGQVLAPWIEPPAKLGGMDAILRELASEAEPKRDYERSGQSGAQTPSPVRSLQPPSTGLTEEPLLSFLSSAAQPRRHYKLFPFLVALVLVLIGLSIVHFYYRGFLPAPPLRSVQSSTQQPVSSLDLKGAERNTQPENPLLREGKMEKPVEQLQPSSQEKPASEPPLKTTIPQETDPLSSGGQTSQDERRDLQNIQHPQPSVLAVKVSEVSGQIGLPHLRRSPHLEIPATVARTVTKPLVVQLKVSPEGKVVGSQMINEGQENKALVPIVQATLSEWEFTSTQAAPGATLVKYFSFKIVQANDATATRR